MNHKHIIPLVLVLVGLIGIGAQQSHATKESPYWAGYGHGVSDAKNNGNTTSYIVQPGKGFDFHTQKFNQGYIDGFCSILDNGAGSDADQATFTCP